MSMIPAIVATAVLASACLLPGSVQAQPMSADSLKKARSNCLTAVANVVNRPRVSLRVIHNQAAASGVSVIVRVPQATAPWACRTDRQGTVEDVFFTGSEGAL